MFDQNLDYKKSAPKIPNKKGINIKGDGKSQSLKMNTKMSSGMPNITGNMPFGGNPGPHICGNADKVSYAEKRPNIKGAPSKTKLVFK